MKFLIFILSFLITHAALASVNIHPVLMQQFQNESLQNKYLAVILVVKNKVQIPQRMYLPSERPFVEAKLMQNAELSQQKVLSVINSAIQTDSKVQYKSLWLSNTCALYASIKDIKKIIDATKSELAAVYPNERAHVFPVVISREPMAEPFTYGLNKLRMPEVWRKNKNLVGTNIKVGILDTGIDAEHPDLTGKTIAFKDFVNAKPAPYDDHSHGTHVAGTISGGAKSGTAIGVAPGAKLIVGKVFSAQGSGSTAKILEAMQWISDPDSNPQTNDAPALVSNSWGGGNPSAGMDPSENPYCRAVDGWVKLGILPVFAAGNSGSGAKTVNLPGGCPAALTVGATDSNDQIASFSSRGPAVWKTGSMIKPTVSAPGVAVLSSVPGGKYKSYSGTSMATPHTAGLATLVYQTNPNINVEAVTKLLTTGAVDLGAQGNDNDYGFGRIDALNTLKVIFGN
ncbi:MAG: S8 family serine peptidase [Oligoflexia bacterium]|nr:S8 family serine peptidase [Oligoflexia bacterium]